MEIHKAGLYRVSLFRIFKLYKSEAPEMKENKQYIITRIRLLVNYPDVSLAESVKGRR